MTPNLFVVGVPKAGTTTLFDILKESKEIFAPKVKEIHYLSKSSIKNSYYKPNIPENDEEYLSLFNQASGEKYRMDCSPSYLYSNDALEYFRNNKKSIKVVVMLRDPIERSISHYSMDLSKGFIDVPIKDVINNPEIYPQQYREYITLSRYEDFLPKWIQQLGKENVFIIKMEDFKSKQKEVLNTLGAFLGIFLDDLKGNNLSSNTAFLPRSKLIVRARQSKLLFRIYQSMPSQLKKLATIASTKPMKKKPVSSDEQKQISDTLKSSEEFYQTMLEDL